MHIQNLKRYLTYSLLVASFTLMAVSARAQDKKADPIAYELPHLQNSCPKPITLTLNATTPNVVNSDFTASNISTPRSWLNDPAPDKLFIYSFQWQQEERCCEITRAVLTVKMKSILGGTSNTSADAGNDRIGIMYQGNTVQPFYEPVYSSWPFKPGQPSVKTWNITGAALNNLNASHNLSFYVQDDTMVQSATLQVSGCCLSTPRK